MNCFNSVRVDLEDLEENCNVKGDPLNRVVQFYTFLGEVEIKKFLDGLQESNEHMKGYEIKSITPPTAAGESTNDSAEGAKTGG